MHQFSLRGGKNLHKISFILESNIGTEIINEDDNRGWNALHFAAEKGHKDIVKKLIENGANKDATDNEGWTALHLAAANGHLDIVEKLVEKKANKDAIDNQERTALHFAAANNPEMVAVLSPNPNPTLGMFNLFNCFARCFRPTSGRSNSQVTPDDSVGQSLNPVVPTR